MLIIMWPGSWEYCLKKISNFSDKDYQWSKEKGKGHIVWQFSVNGFCKYICHISASLCFGVEGQKFQGKSVLLKS